MLLSVMFLRLTCFLLSILAASSVMAADHAATSTYEADKFAQLGPLLPAPTAERLASGAPGPGYWQQRADYVIHLELDEAERRITASETITYFNNSPHTLAYLWLQLGQNMLDNDSIRQRSSHAPNFGDMTYRSFQNFLERDAFEGGHEIGRVADGDGNDLPYTIVATNMRIDLPEPLAPGESIVLEIDFAFNIVGEEIPIRHGSKKTETGEYTYQLAQWFPRMCAYYDVEGWQNRPYILSGEFALEFGDYEVHITVPADFAVGATGVLANPDEVLSETERARLEEAAAADRPVMIVTGEEAAAKIENPAQGKRTWTYEAENVRGFAFGCSRAYMWDAMAVEIDGQPVMAHSLYPEEADELWGRYSTESIVQALEVYSRDVFPYPYPACWSIWGAVTGGMEYPMVTFQQSRDIDEEGTYPLGVRNYVIGVIIHEVGHMWFPMIVNSDERQWMWLDEGLNSFVDDIGGQEFDPRFHESYKASIQRTMAAMARPNDPTIMMAADSLTQRGYQAYSKPSLGLTVLKDGILGEELFDFSFKEYGRRWKFKRPTPADFFRTMEDASGVDLDWFWRGWFYGNDHVDLAVTKVTAYRLDDGDPVTSKELERAKDAEFPDTPRLAFLREFETRADRHDHLHDWYYTYDKFAPTEKEIEKYEKKIEKLEDWQRELLEFEGTIYAIEVENVGGLVMPVVLEVTFADGSTERLDVPVEVWRYGDSTVRIPLITEKEAVSIQLDPDNAFADTDLGNNLFPREIDAEHFKLKPREKPDNPMREALVDEDADNEDDEDHDHEEEE